MYTSPAYLIEDHNSSGVVADEPQGALRSIAVVLINRMVSISILRFELNLGGHSFN
jgi:hypothetical protein